MHVYRAIVFLSIIAAVVQSSKTFHAASSQNDSVRKNDTITSEHVEIELDTSVRNKCAAIAKKKRKSFSDNIYYKFRCRGFKLPKLKLPKPKIPKIKLPNLPKLPKINPKVIPKIPKLPSITPKRKPSPTRKPSKKPSKKSSKKPTPKPKPKNSKKKSKPKPKPKPKPKKAPPPKKTAKPQPKPSRSPSPRPRPRRKPASPAQLKASFESAKKRLAGNIAKQEKTASKRRVCKTEEYKCGRKCSGRSGPRFLCYYSNNVPKMCTRKTVIPGFCAGQERSGNTCKRTILEPSTCTRNVTITEYCPGAEEGCRFNQVPFGRCLPNKQADECERIKKRKCSYDKRDITTACEEPETECSDCKSRFLLKTCPKTIMERVEVPCKDGASKALPSFDEELLGSGIESTYVRDLLCFDSFFDEEVCKTSPRVCNLFDELFDRHLCASIVCQQCGTLIGMMVSEEIKSVCRSLLDGTCYAAETIPQVKEVASKDKCFENRSVTRMLPCYEEVPQGSICAKGCVTKACRKSVHDVKDYCERNVPEKCNKIKKGECKRETRLVKDCSEERICEYVVQKRFVCFKDREVDVPCAGACDVEDVEQMVCGSEVEEVEAVCREQFEFRCSDVKCSRQVCS